jgi:hypothetical protein
VATDSEATFTALINCGEFEVYSGASLICVKHRTDLFDAITNYNLEEVRSILSYNSSFALNSCPEFEFQYPIHYACFLGHLDIVRELMKFGTDFSAKGVEQPVDVALKYHHRDIVRLLDPSLCQSQLHKL